MAKSVSLHAGRSCARAQAGRLQFRVMVLVRFGNLKCAYAKSCHFLLVPLLISLLEAWNSLSTSTSSRWIPIHRICRKCRESWQFTTKCRSQSKFFHYVKQWSWQCLNRIWSPSKCGITTLFWSVGLHSVRGAWFQSTYAEWRFASRRERRYSMVLSKHRHCR